MVERSTRKRKTKRELPARKVRGGGYQGPDGFVFELTGARLCLDFVNTLDERRRNRPKERLTSYAELVGWSVQSGAIPAGERAELLERASRFPSRATAALRRAKRLREALFATFSSAVARKPPPPEASRELDAAVRRAFARPVLQREKNGYRLEWDADGEALDRMIHPVVRSAVELLSSDDLSRVRICSSDTCAWMFLDQTRNQSRRWCDMTTCGNRAKARRFYRKHKSEDGE